MCVRADGNAVLAGSIVSVGNHYLIGLKATDCQNGEILANADAEAENRDRVLKALSTAGNDLRQKIGRIAGIGRAFQQTTRPGDDFIAGSAEGFQRGASRVTRKRRARGPAIL